MRTGLRYRLFDFSANLLLPKRTNKRFKKMKKLLSFGIIHQKIKQVGSLPPTLNASTISPSNGSVLNVYSSYTETTFMANFDSPIVRAVNPANISIYSSTTNQLVLAIDASNRTNTPEVNGTLLTVIVPIGTLPNDTYYVLLSYGMHTQLL